MHITQFSDAHTTQQTVMLSPQTQSFLDLTSFWPAGARILSVFWDRRVVLSRL